MKIPTILKHLHKKSFTKDNHTEICLLYCYFKMPCPYNHSETYWQVFSVNPYFSFLNFQYYSCFFSVVFCVILYSVFSLPYVYLSTHLLASFSPTHALMISHITSLGASVFTASADVWVMDTLYPACNSADLNLSSGGQFEWMILHRWLMV